VIAINPNAEAAREERTYACDSCGRDFARTVAINSLGELVGGNFNAPRKCNACKKKIVAIPGEKIVSTCDQCNGEFSYTWNGGPGRRRRRCPDCVNTRAAKPPRDCKVCGQKTPNGLKAFCSEDCRALQRQRQRASSGKHPCGSCGHPCLGLVCRACFRKQQAGLAKDRLLCPMPLKRLSRAATVGRVGEAYFDLISAVEGWRSFAPSGDCTPGIDRILIVDGLPQTVQIKATEELHYGSFRMKDAASDANILCVVSLESGDMWMVAVNRHTSVRLDDEKAWNFCTGKRGEIGGGRVHFKGLNKS
jgi:hypothetical protein